MIYLHKLLQHSEVSVQDLGTLSSETHPDVVVVLPTVVVPTVEVTPVVPTVEVTPVEVAAVEVTPVVPTVEVTPVEVAVVEVTSSDEVESSDADDVVCRCWWNWQNTNMTYES